MVPRIPPNKDNQFRCAKCDNEMTEEKVEAVIKKVSTAFEKVQNNDLK